MYHIISMGVKVPRNIKTQKPVQNSINSLLIFLEPYKKLLFKIKVSIVHDIIFVQTKKAPAGSRCLRMCLCGDSSY